MILVFDGHNFLMKNVYILKNKSEKTFFDEFIKSFLYDIFGFLNSFDNVDAAYVAFDFGSWRKKYIKEKLNIDTYKSNRKIKEEDEKIKTFKKIVFDNVDKIIGLLEIFDVNAFSLYGAEADDIIYTICNKFDKNNIVIISTDNDLVQLVEFKDRWVVKMNSVKSNKKIYVSDNFYYSLFEKKDIKQHSENKTFTTDRNLFLNVDEPKKLDDVYDSITNIFKKNKKSDESVLLDYIKKNKIDVIKTDKKMFILEKIFLGDISDNIEGIKIDDCFIGKQMLDDIKKNNLIKLKENLFDYFLNNEYDSFLNEIKKTNLANINEKNKEDILNKIKMNKKIMFLHETEIPEYLLSKIKNELDKKTKKINNKKIFLNEILEKIDFNNI
jgi:hypothetical protein